MKKRVIAAMRGRDATNPNHRGKANANYRQRLEINGGGIANALSTVQKDNLVIEYEDAELCESESVLDKTCR